MKVRAVPRREWTIVVGGGAVVAAALALSILLACGCASSAQPARDVPDVPDVADGGPGSDAGSNAFLDASPPDGGMLAAGDSLSVRQVTSDGYVVYSDDAAGELYAVPLSGGNAQHIASLGGTFWITGAGSVVFVWSDVNATNVGALAVWSSAKGSHSVSSASLGLVATASTDGSQNPLPEQRRSGGPDRRRLCRGERWHRRCKASREPAAQRVFSAARLRRVVRTGLPLRRPSGRRSVVDDQLVPIACVDAERFWRPELPTSGRSIPRRPWCWCRPAAACSWPRLEGDHSR